MSSAYNHRKRSHRSEYRVRRYNTGRRYTIAPTYIEQKSALAKFFRKVMDFFRRSGHEQSGD